MNIKSTLHTLLAFYATSRRAGHTSAAIYGVLNTPGAMLVFSQSGQLRSYRKFLQRNGHTGVTLEQLDNLRGRSCPVVLDNAAVYDLAAASLREIERLEADNERLRQRSSEHFKQVQLVRMQAGHAEARYARALGEIAWLRLPLWKKALKYLHHALPRH